MSRPGFQPPEDDGFGQARPIRERTPPAPVTVHAGPLYWVVLVVVGLMAALNGAFVGYQKGEKDGSSQTGLVTNQNAVSNALAQGMANGRQAGYAEGREEGRKLGREEGFQLGQTNGFELGMKAAPAIWPAAKSNELARALSTRLKELQQGPELVNARQIIEEYVTLGVKRVGLFDRSPAWLIRFPRNQAAYQLPKNVDWLVRLEPEAKLVRVILPSPQPVPREIKPDPDPWMWKDDQWRPVDAAEKQEVAAVEEARLILREQLGRSARRPEVLARQSEEYRQAMLRAITPTVQLVVAEAAVVVEFDDSDRTRSSP